jgi:hypothetical protein
MADQDDEGAPTTFLGGVRKGFTDSVGSAIKGAGLVAGAVKQRVVPATPPGGDNTNFPSSTSGATD